MLLILVLVLKIKIKTLKMEIYFQLKLDNTDTSNPYFYAEFIPLMPWEYTVEI